ncbi:MAG: aldehyde dehydrogenase family protein [Bacteroidetes bacterium]|nr:aldehyde dehydrogenase family protein [Bacteroidota bacterium]MDA0888142.1 aldehyde dehydrogenase family protein [Bacteroidota bacterium]MDA1084094.1 aldehyde dehydrogenase family protein [Bacteroidota bacterium]
MIEENTLIQLKSNQTAFFEAGNTRSTKKRITRLKALKQNIKSNEAEIVAALQHDLAKPEAEIWLAEIYVALVELNTVIKNLALWAKPKRIPGKWLNFPSKDWIVPEPYGVTLHIAPWNYPFQLALNPLIGAVAAGNTVVLKPSEHAPETAKILQKIISKAFPPDWVCVAEGGPEVAHTLLKQRWDYIFFTGGISIAKIVAKAAAEHLTPTTLELGGKNPCIVDHSANIAVSARRIAWGKFMNCGQVCMSPDYVLVHEDIYEDLVTALKAEIIRMYGENPQKSTDYARLVHQGHVAKMKELLKGQNIILGGVVDEKDRYVSPTLVALEHLDNSLMADEIFGPLLPIITYKDEAEIHQTIKRFEKPLSFYVFSQRKKWARKLMKTYSYGGGMINDVIVYFTNDKLPFGGVGHSGTGSYHGKHSFDTFSHNKTYVERSTWFDPKQRYAPYTNNFKIIKRLLKYFS